jgi:energy-coupling factor transport system substrate-specific component
VNRAIFRSIPFVGVNLAGVLAFALPFLAGSTSAPEHSARAADAPWLLALLVPLLLAVAIAQASGGQLDARGIALLGVLAGLAALMRLPISFAGANLMFFLPIVGGFVLGPRFGFLLGALAMGASAAITGGLGPWLPFQMWTAGWVGAGAGLLKPLGERLTSRPAVAALLLSVYGYVAGLAYGFLINLYFWPLASVSSEIGWTPGLAIRESVDHYWRFYLLTSLAYDAFRGVGNVVVIILAGVPVIDLLRRYRQRFGYEFVAPLDARPAYH